MVDDRIVQEKFRQTLEIYKKDSFDNEGTPILCKIHDAFGGMENEHHNCLGCNFADSQTLIENYLINYETYIDIQCAFPMYFITLYLLVERMETVMDIVQVPEKFREKHFKVFQQVRKWANFVKHPKAFILTHHPDYNFEGSGYSFNKNFQVVINEQFVDEYYKGEREPEKQKKKNKELYDKLKNQRNIQVIFPDIAKLTEKLCYSINKFGDLIVKNEVYKEILADESTISNYFENQESDD